MVFGRVVAGVPLAANARRSAVTFRGFALRASALRPALSRRPHGTLRPDRRHDRFGSKVRASSGLARTPANLPGGRSMPDAAPSFTVGCALGKTLSRVPSRRRFGFISGCSSLCTSSAIVWNPAPKPACRAARAFSCAASTAHLSEDASQRNCGSAGLAPSSNLTITRDDGANKFRVGNLRPLPI